MGLSDFILASTEDTTVKLIGAVIVLVIWGISSLSAAAKKSQQKAAQNQRQRRPAAPPTIPMIPGRARGGGPATAIKRAPAVPPRLPQLPKQRAVPLPPLRNLAGPAKSATIAKAVPAPGLKPAKVSTPIPKRAPQRQPTPEKIADLLQPRTLRAQFILAEVLQPPLALRARKNF